MRKFLLSFWDKIKMGLTPFFILFYIILILLYINRDTIIRFFSAMYKGNYGYNGINYIY